MPRQQIQADTWSSNWEKLKFGIYAILGRKQSKLKLTDLYDSVENLMISNPKILENALSDIIQNHYNECLSKLSVLAGYSLFDTFSQIVDDFYLYSSLFPMIVQLYDNHNENNVQSSQTLDTIRLWFKMIILDNTDLMKACIAGLRQNLLAARNQSNYDIKNSHNLIKIFLDFRDSSPLFDQLYQYLIEDTKQFYQGFYKSKFEDNSFLNYLGLSFNQFSREIDIINSIFNSDISQPKSPEKLNIFRTVFEQLIANHSDQFINGDEPLISAALTSSNITPFKCVVSAYQNFNLNPEIFCIACGNFIKRQMLSLASNFKKQMKTNEIQENINMLITTCQTLSKPYKLLFSEVENSNRILDNCIIEAWNNPQFDIEQNFCVYIDFQIRSEFRNMSQKEKDEFPSTVATFYSYLTDKFKFSSIYDTFLARRFIKMGLKVVEIELPTINAIKSQKAQGFAKNFKQYIKTVYDSQFLESSFKNEINRLLTKEQQQQATFSFSPIVFDQKYFPFDKNIVTMLPPQLKPIHNAFCSYYTEKRPNYKLLLIQDISFVEFKLYIPRNAKSPQPRTYTITSDIISATIIDKISNGPIRYQDIVGSTSDSKLIDLHLKRLAQKELPILAVKNGGAKQDNVFSLNQNFYSQSQRFVIPPIVNERKKDMAQIIETVNNDKAQSIKAAIVRILKNKTRLPQVKLENSVIIDMAPYFKAEIGLIRRMINELEVEAYLTKTSHDNTQILEFIA